MNWDLFSQFHRFFCSDCRWPWPLCRSFPASFFAFWRVTRKHCRTQWINHVQEGAMWDATMIFFGVGWWPFWSPWSTNFSSVAPGSFRMLWKLSFIFKYNIKITQISQLFFFFLKPVNGFRNGQNRPKQPENDAKFCLLVNYAAYNNILNILIFIYIVNDAKR